MNLNDLKEQIPKNYHWILNRRLLSTDELSSRTRSNKLHKRLFNRCEKCGFDLLNPRSYQNKYPSNGFVHYYKKYQSALCDKCVDEENGHSWK